MSRRDIADELYSIVIKRYLDEKPDKELTSSEKDSIWYGIYGKLCRGESKESVKKWCETAPLK